VHNRPPFIFSGMDRFLVCDLHPPGGTRTTLFLLCFSPLVLTCLCCFVHVMRESSQEFLFYCLVSPFFFPGVPPSARALLPTLLDFVVLAQRQAIYWNDSWFRLWSGLRGSLPVFWSSAFTILRFFPPSRPILLIIPVSPLGLDGSCLPPGDGSFPLGLFLWLMSLRHFNLPLFSVLPGSDRRGSLTAVYYTSPSLFSVFCRFSLFPF